MTEQTKWLTVDDITPKRVPLETMLDELGMKLPITPPTPKRTYVQPGRSVAKSSAMDLTTRRFLARHILDRALPNGDTHVAVVVRITTDGKIEVVDEFTLGDVIASEYDQLPPIPLDEGFLPVATKRSSQLFRRYWDEDEKPKPYTLKEFPFKPLFEQRLPPRVLFKGKR